MRQRINTERISMEQRECAAQLINRESEHRHKKSIPMNAPTRCRRQNNLHKETSDTTCRHEKHRDNVCTQRIDGNAQTEVVILHTFLACSLAPLHKDTSHNKLTTSVVSLETDRTGDQSIELNSTKTARGTCFPAPVSEKKVLNTSSLQSLVLSPGICSSRCIPRSRQNNFQHALPTWMSLLTQVAADISSAHSICFCA